MDILPTLFPDVPHQVLEAVLRICGDSTEAASEWMLENNWRDIEIQLLGDVVREQNEVEGNVGSNHGTASLASPGNGNVSDENHLERRHEYHNSYRDSDEHDDYDNGENDDDDDLENEDDDQEDGYFVEGDFFPPLSPTKRRKIDTTPAQKVDKAETRFWACFDDKMVNKGLIELLNTRVTSLAHRFVCLSHTGTHGEAQVRGSVTPMRSVLERGIGKDRDVCSSSKDSATSEMKISGSSNAETGFWAYFFPVSDLDMVWRSLLHAHLLNKRFGEVVEFHTVSEGRLDYRGFDELSTAFQNHPSEHPSLFRCCLLFPCPMDKKTVAQVGEYVHKILSLRTTPIYYRTINAKPATLIGTRGKNWSIVEERDEMSELDHKEASMYMMQRKEHVVARDKQTCGIHAHQAQKTIVFKLSKHVLTGWCDEPGEI